MVREGMRLEIKIDPELCIGCGACSSICPTNAITIEFDDRAASVIRKPEKCIYCLSCIDSCPNDALKTVQHNHVYFTITVEEVQMAAIKCVRCGKPFATYKHAEKVRDMIINKISISIRDVFLEDYKTYHRICPECRKKIRELTPLRYLVLKHEKI